MLDEGQFGSGMELTKVYLIHEGADEEDATAGAAEEIFRGEWVGQGFGVEAFALVGDGDDERRAVVLKAGGDVLGGVVVVAVEDGVNGGLAHGHGEAESLVFVEARLGGKLFGGGFDFADAFHG